MPTYRCKSCTGIYVNPQNGVEFPHVCPPAKVDLLTGKVTPQPHERNENWELVGTWGKLPEGVDTDERTNKRARRHKVGLGREKLDDGDVLTGADAAAIAVLQKAPGVADPDV